MASDTFLFLDFDGVLCDSLPETLVSSWLAFHQYILHDLPDSLPIDFKKRFSEMRPFIRSGEDYLLLQILIQKNASVRGQPEFDEIVAKAGEPTMAFYKEIFYKARQNLLDQYPEYWIELNPMYPLLENALKQNNGRTDIYILSTKKSDFVHEILAGNGIEFVKSNIIDSGKERKVEIIKMFLDLHHIQQALFIDDQIDHLVGDIDPRISVYLADWGYVKKEWLRNSYGIPILHIGQAAALLSNGNFNLC